MFKTNLLFSTVMQDKNLSWCCQSRATRLEVSQSQQTWYHSISYVWFPIRVL